MKRFVFIIALIATSAVYVPEVAYSQISDGESIISVNRTPVLKAVPNGIEITVQGYYIVKCSEWTKKIVVR